MAFKQGCVFAKRIYNLDDVETKQGMAEKGEGVFDR